MLAKGFALLPNPSTRATLKPEAREERKSSLVGGKRREDVGSVTRRESDNHMAINNTESEIFMKVTTNDKRSLLHMENLTLPSVGLLIYSAIHSP
ncbi:unnamed protein product [Sphenostylis stenocarpa]|uniref:Uncharacterized protein n=1 Tax=Sphenostylis stenocarpa TaxID=92480 RepID=A0AA86SYI7_9FABA|nr:unnamed protein product [Sphenostylis stenocarpa]